MLAARRDLHAGFLHRLARLQRHEPRQLVLARLQDVRGLHQHGAAGGGQRSLPIGQGFGRGLDGPLGLGLVRPGGGSEYLRRVRGVHYLRGLAGVCGDPLAADEVQGFYLRFDQESSSWKNACLLSLPDPRPFYEPAYATSFSRRRSPTEIPTTSPALSVKSSSGTIPVPVIRKAPPGKASSLPEIGRKLLRGALHLRSIHLVLEDDARPPRRMLMVMRRSRIESGPQRTMPGPREQEPS